MVYLPAGLLALSAALLVHTTLRPDPHGVKAWSEADLPSQAQIIRRSSFAVLDNVPPPSQANISTVSSLVKGRWLGWRLIRVP